MFRLHVACPTNHCMSLRKSRFFELATMHAQKSICPATAASLTFKQVPIPFRTASLCLTAGKWQCQH